MTNNKKLEESLDAYCKKQISEAERCCPACHKYALRCFSEKNYYGARAYVDAYLAAQKEAEGLVEALKFYAPENNYDYDKVKDQNYIWNDQGKRAREALKKYESGGEG